MTYTKQICYIDCTNTVTSGHNTGVQRVVKCILATLPEISKRMEIPLIPVIAIKGNFYRADYNSCSRRYFSKICFGLLALLRNKLDALFSPKKVVDLSVDIFDSEDEAKGFHSKIVYAARKIKPILFKIAYKLDNIISDIEAIEFNDNDILFIPDAFWNRELIEAIKENENNAIQIVILIHDIIALTNKDLFEERFCRNFASSFNYYMQKSIGVICVSQTAMNEVSSIAHRLNNKLLIDYIYWGADFAYHGNKDRHIRGKIKKLFSSLSIYLMVGTIEPRKNHLEVLLAFEILWNAGIDVKLCIVGRVGWECKNILEKIVHCSQFDKKVFFVNDMNDSELDYSYEKAKAVIVASITEGFGLPLVEAMHYGKPLFASDISVFREIGDDYPIYFPLGNPDSLAGLIYAFENGKMDRKFDSRPWMTWDESIENLMRKVVAMADK
jgi:O-antigen biosynthesis alpha-1,2-rhamnosyltransferase